MIILLLGSSSFYSIIIVISTIGADRNLNHFFNIMARVAHVIGGQQQMRRAVNEPAR